MSFIFTQMNLLLLLNFCSVQLLLCKLLCYFQTLHLNGICLWFMPAAHMHWNEPFP